MYLDKNNILLKNAETTKMFIIGFVTLDAFLNIL